MTYSAPNKLRYYEPSATNQHAGCTNTRATAIINPVPGEAHACTVH
eukprot:CAMPEP_0119313424 /NCGR_PEP_ID=MMETSP1333-20130426/29085_1 /TAXON_ID=418940 /ORGANISM="Scyphosphaera apsteinii, Strain RCC1455" /LENGTH=45 /DNA_ID= /DNA_START= /DNA_END= /DNA_ORIENTATION=